MDPMYKTKWVNALRSGQFIQGKSFLNNVDEGTHCCLGVLCKILEADGLITSEVIQENFHNPDGGTTRINVTRFIGDTQWDRETSLLPQKVSNLLGLTYIDRYEDEADEVHWIDDPVITYRDTDGHESTSTLSSINDNGWYNFNAIADLIEAQL